MGPLIQLMGKQNGVAMLHTDFPCRPATAFLGIDPEELKTLVHAKTCTQMFLAGLVE
jgi:hypothetical protein